MVEQKANAKNNKQMDSVFDLLGKSAEIVKKNWVAFAVVNVFAVLTAIGNAFGGSDKSDTSWYYDTGSQASGLSGGELAAILGFGGITVLLLLIVNLFLFTMMISLEVKSTAGKKPGLSELFEDGKKYFFRMLGVLILAGLMIFGGFILLIIPGIFALGRLIMSPYQLVDKNLSVTEAIKQSNNQAKGNMWPIYAAILLTVLVSIFVSIIGAVPVVGPLAGVVITIAFSLIIALRYQQLKKA